MASVGVMCMRGRLNVCAGTIVDFLDEFEPVCNNMCQHRNTLQKCRDSARDFEQNAVPGMVGLDTDWAENLTISKARLLQTQYYNLVRCSLLITAVQYLDKAAFLPCGFVFLSEIGVLCSFVQLRALLKFLGRRGEYSAEFPEDALRQPLSQPDSRWAVVGIHGPKPGRCP